MTRPAPTIYLTRRLSDEHRLEVVSGRGMFIVLYHGQPFNLIEYRGKSKKYKNTANVNQGWAEILAAKLNAEFETDAFTVEKVA